LLPLVQQQKDCYAFWINSGRLNELWQSVYHDEYVAFRMARWPLAMVEIHPEDAAGLGIQNGDIIEIYNDYGATTGMAYHTPSAKPGQVFMVAMFKAGVHGDVVTNAVDENIVPYYKGTWGNIRRIVAIPDYQQNVSFKNRHYG
jgi:arsenite oxidase large subunit